MKAYIFYTKAENALWANAIVVPIRGLMIPAYLLGVLLLTVIGLGLLVAYWVSRVNIQRSIKPLQLLAKSADGVSKGHFQNPLPELKHND